MSQQHRRADLEKLVRPFDPNATSGSTTSGPEPIPLTHRVEVPAFPVDALPKPIADMVNARGRGHPDRSGDGGHAALSALSACTGGHAVIELRSGWREPLNIYTVAIAEPGERKSRGAGDDGLA